MNFTIDPKYLCSVTIRKEWNVYRNNRNPTEDDVVQILRGLGECSSTHTEDHPEFAKLREQLGREGFIRIERGWWNGDIVLKPFTLNGARYRKGESFSSSGPTKHIIDTKLRQQNDK